MVYTAKLKIILETRNVYFTYIHTGLKTERLDIISKTRQLSWYQGTTRRVGMTLTFDLSKKTFKWHIYSLRRQLCQIIFKSIHNYRSYGPDRQIVRRMDARSHIHPCAVVTSMSRPKQVGLTNKIVLTLYLICHFWALPIQ